MQQYQSLVLEFVNDLYRSRFDSICSAKNTLILSSNFNDSESIVPQSQSIELQHYFTAVKMDDEA